MDLDQEIQVINSKNKIFSPEEKHKWKMQELPPVPKGNNRNIPVSIQELVYGGKAAGVGTSSKSLDRHNELISSSEEVHGPRKDRGSSEGLAYMSCKGQVQQIEAWFKSQSKLSADQKKKLAQGKENSPVEAPQASTSKNPPLKVPNKGKQSPENNQKGKEKTKWNKPYQQNYRIPKREKTAMGNLFNSLKKDLVHIYPAASSFKLLLDKLRNHSNQIMNDSFEYAKQKWDKIHKTPEFKVGNLILVSTLNFNNIKGPKKSKYSFSRPFIIKALHGTNAVQVQLSGELENKHPALPVSLVKHYTSSDKELFPLRNETPLEVPPLDQSEEKKVLKVLKER
ncbi:hypothetical protein O181_095739 [Austropuccinia psidii MF-1]|uniref:Uncharacterized protein n=1 Tax=Austropuccinia psidii MF-1 TaxID=1389203 RepID=A0A9Q3PC15_9BASI|nr:hypothetical protein [Austropuccinia psidii MF-1]